jgi:hypothetical protein
MHTLQWVAARGTDAHVVVYVAPPHPGYVGWMVRNMSTRLDFHKQARGLLPRNEAPDPG